MIDKQITKLRLLLRLMETQPSKELLEQIDAELKVIQEKLYRLMKDENREE